MKKCTNGRIRFATNLKKLDKMHLVAIAMDLSEGDRVSIELKNEKAKTYTLKGFSLAGVLIMSLEGRGVIEVKTASIVKMVRVKK